MTQTTPPLKEFLDTLALIPDRQERIELLMSVADRFESVPDSVASRPFPEECRAPHCESEAFVFTEPLENGRFKYHFAVENPQGISAMATAVILDEAFSNQDPREVLAVSADVIYDIFGRELSMGKGMGLMGMIQLLQSQTKQRLAKQPGATEARTPS